jgi:hypothetical protein
VSPVRVRSKEPDQACAEAVDLARAALAAVVGAGQVGQHLSLEAGGDRVVTHLFECLDPAYPGWRWAVTVTRASRAKTVTVDDSALLPGPGALMAPAWVPWVDRLQPGDLGVGDLLPTGEDDERLVPMVMLAGDDAVVDWYADGPAEAPDPVDARRAPSPVFPGRVRVLSPGGRDDTADRWYDGEHGPDAPVARAAPARCASCGFFVPLSGVLGQVFGGCANAYAPDDGRVVSGDHGCGAHSESTLTGTLAQAAAPVVDELGYDLVDLPEVLLDETVFESFSDES